MKKFISLALAVIMLVSLASCGKKTDTEVIPVTPTDGQSTTPSQSPANNIGEPSKDPQNTTPSNPNTVTPTAPQGQEPTNPQDQTPTDNKLDNVIDDPANTNNNKTESVSGIKLNEVFSETGDQVDVVQGKNKTTYTVKYSRALSLVVEVSQKHENGKTTIMTDAYLNHYSIYIGAGKKVSVKMGNFSKTETLPAITHEDDSSARTKLISAEYVAAKGEIVEININMPYEGNYGDKYIKSLSFSGSVTTD